MTMNEKVHVREVSNRETGADERKTRDSHENPVWQDETPERKGTT
jgi:hypothetical protein